MLNCSAIATIADSHPEFQMSAEIEDNSPASNSVATLVKPQNFPVQNLYRQAQNFWADILPKYAGQTILTITHGGTIKALIGEIS